MCSREGYYRGRNNIEPRKHRIGANVLWANRSSFSETRKYMVAKWRSPMGQVNDVLSLLGGY